MFFNGKSVDDKTNYFTVEYLHMDSIYHGRNDNLLNVSSNDDKFKICVINPSTSAPVGR